MKKIKYHTDQNNPQVKEYVDAVEKGGKVYQDTKKSELKIKVSHPDPKIEKQGLGAVLGLIDAIRKLTGEKVDIKQIYD